MSRIVVIGSGIAGLFAALRLDEAGHDVVIITKQRPKIPPPIGHKVESQVFSTKQMEKERMLIFRIL